MLYRFPLFVMIAPRLFCLFYASTLTSVGSCLGGQVSLIRQQEIIQSETGEILDAFSDVFPQHQIAFCVSPQSLPE